MVEKRNRTKRLRFLFIWPSSWQVDTKIVILQEH